MVIVKKEKNETLFQNHFKLMFKKYNEQCKMDEGHLNSYFYKKSKFYKVCNDSKIMCVLILWLILEIETPKSN
jgi:hypothetical protein